MALVDDLPGMAYRCANDREWTMQFVSRGAEALTGYSVRELVGSESTITYGSLIHPDDRDRVWRHIQRRIEHRQRFRLTYRIRTATGAVKWVWEQGRAEFSPTGEVEHLEGFIIDVTERRLAEERFVRLFNATPLGVLIWDLEGPSKLVLVGANRAAGEMLGVDTSQRLGQPMDEALPGLVETEVPEACAYLAREGGSWESSELSYRGRKTAGIFSIRAFQTFPGQVAAMFEDVTEREEQERQIRQLSSAVEQTSGSVVITDREGRIEYVNPAFESLSGYSRGELVGERINVVKSGEHDEAFYASMWETITRGDVWQGTFVNRRKDGSLFREEKTISPIRDGDGRIGKFIALGRDITREIDLRRQVYRAQRLESVGRLASGVAHDFNNLLTTLLGNIDYALEAVERGELPAREDLQAVKSAGVRAAVLTSRLLAFSRQQPLEFSRIRVDDVVEGLRPLIARTIGTDVSLDIDLASDGWCVSGDPGQLEQVVLNLVVNAVDAMPDGGKLEIRTRHVEVDRDRSTGEAVPGGPYVVFSVSDTGIGMGARTRERIFDPFFTTKGESRGTGLGLATSHGIVEQHDGHILVDSELGKGTTFTVYLPRLDDGSAKPERAPQVLAESGDGRPDATVLVVDDNRPVLALAARHLRDAGYETLEATDPTRALEVLESRASEVGLLVTDAAMPQMSGRELAARFVELNPAGRVLIVSGHPDSRDLDESGQRHAFLRKPFTAEELLAHVREVLDGGAS